MPVKITSRYTPLTYDEITKPLIQATEAQMALEDAYATVGDSALATLSKVDPQADQETYNRLKAYAEDLQTQADSLARYGLQRNSRQALLNLRRRYRQEVTPVDEAFARRKAMADEQRKLRASNPYLRFERDMSTTNLGSFIDNPELDYGRTIDLKDISNRAAAMTKALGQGRTDVRNGKQIDEYQKEVLIREGFTPEEIQAALSNDANANSALKTGLNNLYASTGASSFGTDVDAEVRDALNYGAYLGAGEVKSHIMTDKEAERRDFEDDRKHSEAFQAALYGMYKDSEGNWAYDPTRPGPKVKGKLKADGSADGVTDEDFEFVPKEVTGSNDYYKKKDDGTWWHKNGKNYYPVTEAQTVETLNNNYVSPVRLSESRINLKKEPLYFAGKNFEVIRENNSSFSEDDATKVDVASLSTEAKLKLFNTLKENYPGIKITDVDIYKDADLIGKDEYKIVLKDSK